ncbi:MAG: TetR/AcrR family transcriptional regulator, partial [Myxococcota bacterium]
MNKRRSAGRPRKQPVQERSRATVAAIHRATIQVLNREGLARCTTTRVAERAGVS